MQHTLSTSNPKLFTLFPQVAITNSQRWRKTCDRAGSPCNELLVITVCCVCHPFSNGYFVVYRDICFRTVGRSAYKRRVLCLYRSKFDVGLPGLSGLDGNQRRRHSLAIRRTGIDFADG